MTKAELMELLKPYPDDIEIVWTYISGTSVRPIKKEDVRLVNCGEYIHKDLYANQTYNSIYFKMPNETFKLKIEEFPVVKLNICGHDGFWEKERR